MATNKDNDIYPLIKKILKSAKLIEITNESEKGFQRIPIFALAKTLELDGKDCIDNFQKVKYLIWKNKVQENFTLNSIYILLINYLAYFLDNSIEIKRKDIKALKQNNLVPDHAQFQKKEVFRPIYGITFETTSPIKLGPFTIYNLDLHESSFIYKKYPKIIDSYHYNHSTENKLYLISFESKAIEEKRLLEKADFQFELFESVIRFIAGSKGRTLGIKDSRTIYYDVGIFDFIGSKRFNSLALDSKGVYYQSHNKLVMEPLDISDSFFINKEIGNEQIWEILNKDVSKRTELEISILTAIEWLGKGRYEARPEKSFIDSMIAFETLNCSLEGLNKGKQLAALATQILKLEKKESKKIFKLVSAYYKKRSKVFHEGSKNVNENDDEVLFSIVKRVIVELLKSDDLKNIKNKRELQKWLENKIPKTFIRTIIYKIVYKPIEKIYFLLKKYL